MFGFNARKDRDALVRLNGKIMCQEIVNAPHPDIANVGWVVSELYRIQ